MNKKLYTKIISITLLLAVFDVVMFSEGLVNLSIFGRNIKETLISLGIIFANIIVLFLSFKTLTSTTEGKYGYDLDKLKNSFDYKNALESCKYKNSPFLEEINRAISDVLSMEKKHRVLEEILEQSDKTEFDTLTNLAHDSKEYLFKNTRRILNRISIADSGEGSGNISEHKAYIEKILTNNDKILSEFGKFLTEVSRMDDPEDTVDITQVLGDMVGSLKMLRGEDDELERKYENGKK